MANWLKALLKRVVADVIFRHPSAKMYRACFVSTSKKGPSLSVDEGCADESRPDGEEQQPPEPVTIRLFAHWICPACKKENAERLEIQYPLFLTCMDCKSKTRTMTYL